jgi:hypothetical protein
MNSRTPDKPMLLLLLTTIGDNDGNVDVATTSP